MFAYQQAFAVDASSTDDQFARAGELLLQGKIVIYQNFLILKPVGDHLVCEVIDREPLSHRCAEEFAVMVENARLALATSGLNLAGRILQWRVVEERSGEIVELWRA